MTNPYATMKQLATEEPITTTAGRVARLLRRSPTVDDETRNVVLELLLENADLRDQLRKASPEESP